MASFASLASFKTNLIRKLGTGGTYYAPETADALGITAVAAAGGAPATVSIVDTDGRLKALPPPYRFTGLTTDAGIRFGRSVSEESDTAWQLTEPARTDVTEDIETAAMDLKETSKASIELYTGADLSAAQLTAQGWLQIDKPRTPAPRYFRLLCVGVDFFQGQEAYCMAFMPRAKVTDYGEQAFSKDAGGLQWPLTFTAFNDPNLGFSMRRIYGGPGFLAAATAMGFTVTT